MSLRFPLYAKILLWLFLNFVVLGVAFYVLVKAQFRLGLDSLLAGRAGDRIQAVGEVIAAELSERPRADWNDVLERFSAAYRVQFLLYRNDGAQLAGAPLQLPRPVHAKLTDRPGPPHLRNVPFEAPPPPRPGPGTDGHPDRLGPPPRPVAPPGRGRFMVRTENPVRYWVGTRLLALERERARPGPVTLIAVSDSLRGGGLFFDPAPWIAVGAGVVLFSVLFWLPLVRGIGRAILQMTRATERIAEGRFDTRVGARRADELGRLGAAIDHMAARLGGFVTGQKRFLGDIAHELCSPIARLQVALGILEQRADENQKRCVEDVREEVQHMSNLVNELLCFSKASLGGATIQLQPVALRALVEDVVRRETTLEINFQMEIPPDLTALCEPELLKRALANLIRNAIRYAGQAGPISLSAKAHNGTVTLTIADQGPGVPEASLPQIFDPFFRVEASRSRDTGGIGLGLAIVKTCIEACHGTVTARNRQPSGLQVEVALRAPK